MDAAHVTRRPAAAGAKRLIERAAPAPQNANRLRMIQAVTQQLLAREDEFQKLGLVSAAGYATQISDFVFAVEDEPHVADSIFPSIRWGGQFVYLSYSFEKVQGLPAEYSKCGFEVLHGPAYLKTGALRFVPFMGRKLWYFVARKLHLVRPREITERFTYNVQLAHPNGQIETADPYVVVKEIPTLERVVARLRAKFTDVPYSVIEKRALKFTNKVFPLFLTREAAMLKILNRDFPEEYRSRVPTLLHMESDDRGYTKKMWMNWMRIGGKPLSQLEFARQSADLLRVLHDTARVIHLDLRLDNMLITPAGVCFVDFGSAVRVGENIQGNPLLSTLFEELMRTSQIQRMLSKMTSSGTVTSQLISEAAGRADKQVDLFYLAVQINQPLHNPDFAGLVEYDPKSDEAEALADLTRDILKPADPALPKYRTAAEMLKGIEEIARRLGK
jgi:hypothetical protein